MKNKFGILFFSIVFTMPFFVSADTLRKNLVSNVEVNFGNNQKILTINSLTSCSGLPNWIVDTYIVKLKRTAGAGSQIRTTMGIAGYNFAVSDIQTITDDWSFITFNFDHINLQLVCENSGAVFPAQFFIVIEVINGGNFTSWEMKQGNDFSEWAYTGSATSSLNYTPYFLIAGLDLGTTTQATLTHLEFIQPNVATTTYAKTFVTSFSGYFQSSTSPSTFDRVKLAYCSLAFPDSDCQYFQFPRGLDWTANSAFSISTSTTLTYSGAYLGLLFFSNETGDAYKTVGVQFTSATSTLTASEITEANKLTRQTALDACDTMGLIGDTFCKSAVFLFIPSGNNATRFAEITDLLFDRAPFSLLTDAKLLFDELTLNTTVSTTTLVATTTISGIGDVTLAWSLGVDLQGVVEQFPIVATVRQIEGYLLYLAFAFGAIIAINKIL